MQALKLVLGIVALIVVGVGGFVGVKVGTANFDFPDTPLPAIKASTDPAVIAQGAYVAHHVAHCSTCHAPLEPNVKLDLASWKLDTSAPLSGGYTIEAGPFGTFHAANLTPDPQTGIGRYSDEQLARMIRHGVGADGRFLPMMRIGVGPMSNEDLTAVISYLRAQKPVKKEIPPDEFGVLAKMLSSSFSPRGGEPPRHVPSAAEPSVERGGYLANNTAACVFCHTVADPMEGFALTGEPFSGGAPEPDSTDPAYEFVAPNLTPDPTGITGMWDEEQFVKRMRAGRVHAGSIMAWEAFAGMTESDVRSVYRYLKTVKPVANAVTETRRKIQ